MWGSTFTSGFYARLLAKEADGTPPAEADAKEADGADAPATPAADDAEHAPAAGDAPETETLKGAAGVVGEDTLGAGVVVFLLEDARAGGGDAASTFHAVASTESHVAVEHSMGAQGTAPCTMHHAPCLGKPRLPRLVFRCGANMLVPTLVVRAAPAGRAPLWRPAAHLPCPALPCPAH